MQKHPIEGPNIMEVGPLSVSYHQKHPSKSKETHYIPPLKPHSNTPGNHPLHPSIMAACFACTNTKNSEMQFTMLTVTLFSKYKDEIL